MIYFLTINIITFLTACLDKYFAIKKRRRISEKSLLILSLIGGSFGMFIAMHLVRHKTKKKKFYILIPLLMFFQLLMYCIII